MAEKRIKTTLMLIGEALVIWYGMGTPIPTNWTDAIKLIVALLAITYTGWKNHDFTEEGTVGTMITRQMKQTREMAVDTVEEPEDSYVVEDEYLEESEVNDGEE